MPDFSSKLALESEERDRPGAPDLADDAQNCWNSLGLDDDIRFEPKEVTASQPPQMKNNPLSNYNNAYMMQRQSPTDVKSELELVNQASSENKSSCGFTDRKDTLEIVPLEA